MASTWKLLGTATYSSGTSFGITGFTAMPHLKVEGFFKSASGNAVANARFNNDSGNNYPARYQHNGSETNLTTRDNIEPYQLLPMGAGEIQYISWDIINIANQEKLVIGHTTHTASGTGAGNAPVRQEIAVKWTNTSVQITRIDFINNDTGTLSTDSTFTVWGMDDQPSTDKSKTSITNIQAGTRYEEVDTRKIFRKGEKTTANNETGGTNTGTHAFVMVGKITGLAVGETIKSVQVNCGTTDSANWRCGYYSDTSGVPNALMEDIGQVGALSTGFNTGVANGTQVVPSDGIVWVAIQFSTASATYVGRTASSGGYSDSNAYASGLPSTFSSSGADRAVDVKITTTAWVEKGTA